MRGGAVDQVGAGRCLLGHGERDVLDETDDHLEENHHDEGATHDGADGDRGGEHDDVEREREEEHHRRPQTQRSDGVRGPDRPRGEQRCRERSDKPREPAMQRGQSRPSPHGEDEDQSGAERCEQGVQVDQEPGQSGDLDERPHGDAGHGERQRDGDCSSARQVGRHGSAQTGRRGVGHRTPREDGCPLGERVHAGPAYGVGPQPTTQPDCTMIGTIPAWIWSPPCTSCGLRPTWWLDTAPSGTVTDAVVPGFQ